MTQEGVWFGQNTNAEMKDGVQLAKYCSPESTENETLLSMKRHTAKILQILNF